MKIVITDVAIIGAGPAGIAAAVYVLRAGFKATIFEKNIYGGQTSVIDTIENYPGFSKIQGMDFANALYEQAKRLGAEFIFNEVTDVNFDGELKCIDTSSEGKIYTHAVIIANGLKRRLLDCKGEKEFNGKGVSYCATCDGAFFKGKSVIVVGGGNTALEDALYLANICSKVVMVVRKNHFRGEKILVDAVNNTSNIEVLYESNLKEIKGKNFVESVIIEKSEEESIEMDVNGVFIAIGYQPDNKIYKGKIDMNENGYFIADESCCTNISGVYVAGDCRIKSLRQIVTAVCDGAIAGNNASSFVLRKMSSEN